MSNTPETREHYETNGWAFIPANEARRDVVAEFFPEAKGILNDVEELVRDLAVDEPEPAIKVVRQYLSVPDEVDGSQFVQAFLIGSPACDPGMIPDERRLVWQHPDPLLPSVIERHGFLRLIGYGDAAAEIRPATSKGVDVQTQEYELERVEDLRRRTIQFGMSAVEAMGILSPDTLRHPEGYRGTTLDSRVPPIGFGLIRYAAGSCLPANSKEGEDPPVHSGHFDPTPNGDQLFLSCDVFRGNCIWDIGPRPDDTTRFIQRLGDIVVTGTTPNQVAAGEPCTGPFHNTYRPPEDGDRYTFFMFLREAWRLEALDRLLVHTT